MAKYGVIQDGTRFLLDEDDNDEPVCSLCEMPLDPEGEFYRLAIHSGQPAHPRVPIAAKEIDRALPVYAVHHDCMAEVVMQIDRIRESGETDVDYRFLPGGAK